MNKLINECPICKNSVQKNNFEFVGIDEFDFINNENGSNFGFEINFGSISFGNNSVFHGSLEDVYYCEKCKKIFGVFNIEN